MHLSTLFLDFFHSLIVILCLQRKSGLKLQNPLSHLCQSASLNIGLWQGLDSGNTHGVRILELIVHLQTQHGLNIVSNLTLNLTGAKPSCRNGQENTISHTVMSQVQHHILILVVCLLSKIGIIVNGHNNGRNLHAIGPNKLAVISSLKQLLALLQRLFHHMEEFFHLLLIILIDHPAGVRCMFKSR